MLHDDTLPDRVAERLSRDELAIFLVHGVIPRHEHPVRNYTRKHMEADLFARCMRRLSQKGTALSMDDVLDHCVTHKPFPNNAFAMTFDDGFENNVSVVAPILAEYRIPAMVYATSGFVEGNAMSWIDRIEYAVEDAPTQTLHVDWAPEPFPLEDPGSRIRFLAAVRQYVKNSASVAPNAFADALCSHLGKPGNLSTNDPLDRKLTWDQIRDESHGPWLSFGGHSHTHPIMSFLSPEDLAFELDTSLRLMREKGGIGPKHYSYPEGLAHCFSDAVIAEMKKRGVCCSPTAIDGINETGADPFLLRRIMVA
jgi:peptidoglycan/xylan/chitin deacetylase (PgdA/CDA1 family)